MHFYNYLKVQEPLILILSKPRINFDFINQFIILKITGKFADKCILLQKYKTGIFENIKDVINMGNIEKTFMLNL